jgi:hypothetical protein
LTGKRALSIRTFVEKFLGLIEIVAAAYFVGVLIWRRFTKNKFYKAGYWETFIGDIFVAIILLKRAAFALRRRFLKNKTPVPVPSRKCPTCGDQMKLVNDGFGALFYKCNSHRICRQKLIFASN